MDGGLFLCYGYKVEYDEAVPGLSSKHIRVCIQQTAE